MTDRSAAFGVNNITAMVADPTSGYVYFATATGYIYKWNADTGSTVLSAHVGTDLTSLALSADHTYLVAGEANGTADQPLRFEQVDVSDLSFTAISIPVSTTYPDNFFDGYRYGVYSLALTPDNKVIYNSSYALSGDTPVGAFPLSNPAGVVVTIASDLSSGTMFSSENNRYVVVADQYYEPSDITIYDTATGITRQTPFDSLRGAVYGTVSISEAAGLIAYDDSALKVIDLTGQLVHQLSDFYSGGYIAQATAFLPGGHQLLAWDTTNNLLRAYDTQTWAQVGSFSMPTFDYAGSTAPNMVVGDNGQFLDLLGNRQSIDLAAKLSLTVVGDGSDNLLFGAAGADSLSGGGGSDTLDGGGGDDTLDGGPGTDTATYADATSGVSVSLLLQGAAQNTGGAGSDTLISIENLTGSGFNDHLIGDANNNVIDGGAGDDTLDGGAGVNTVSYASAGAGVTVSLAHQGSAQDTHGSGVDTLSNFQNLTGSAYADTLTGDANANVISGGAGNDLINGGGGDDTLDGGTGADTAVFSGNYAAYTVSGSSGTVTVSGPDGADTLTNIEILQFADRQMVVGSAGQTLAARTGGDALFGGVGNDTLNGGPGADVLSGGGGNDSLNGGGGKDTAVFSGNYAAYAITASSGAVTVTGPDGTDTLTNVELLQFTDRQMVVGSAGQTVTARAGGDGLFGGAGNDSLNGGAGADTLSGGGGNDSLDGGGGNDTAVFSGNYAAYAISASGGTVTVKGPDGTDTLINIETLKFADKTVSVASLSLGGIVGTDGADSLNGTSGDDTINGLGGNDTLKGAAGNDTLDGGAGNDNLNGGAGTDTATYADAPSGVSVSLAITGAQNTGGAGTDTLSSIENLTGSAFADTLTAASAGSVLQGIGGADTLVSGAGNDTLDGGDGSDTASYAGAKAAVTVSLGISGQQNTGGAGKDTLISIENLIGSKFNDTLTPGAGVESTDGGAGTDTVVYASAAGAYTIGHSGTTTTVTGGGQTDTLTNVEVLKFADQQLVITDAGAAVTARASGDTLVGGAGKDSLTGGAGNDVLIGNGGNDTLNGAAGTNTAIFHGAFSAYTVTAAKVAGPDGTDSITKIQILQFDDRQVVDGSAATTLHARAGGDVLVGGAGGDTLIGSAANDTLTGGAGKDTLTGGGGADHFVFTAIGDSKVATPDLITDWLAGDHIDLSAIDADTKTSGNQAFHFGATAGHAGDVVVHYDAAHSRTVVDLYIDKDAKADAEIWLTGNHALSSGDFVL